MGSLVEENADHVQTTNAKQYDIPIENYASSKASHLTVATPKQQPVHVGKRVPLERMQKSMAKRSCYDNLATETENGSMNGLIFTAATQKYFVLTYGSLGSEHDSN